MHPLVLFAFVISWCPIEEASGAPAEKGEGAQPAELTGRDQSGSMAREQSIGHPLLSPDFGSPGDTPLSLGNKFPIALHLQWGQKY